ncbi:hypothetical protein DFH07DRAFT_868526 [Mycena maculata]|uniref:DUF6589 domain-containing protein n=1 Tax=Mycena maculata TaxID=230809 RepID=A0AAD7J1K2_9AGAR|nr:hypothetical protein DFH07DRAFT_868526 [Mycena maculata]
MANTQAASGHVTGGDKCRIIPELVSEPPWSAGSVRPPPKCGTGAQPKIPPPPVAAAYLGMEGLSQEELDEIEMDEEADMKNPPQSPGSEPEDWEELDPKDSALDPTPLPPPIVGKTKAERTAKACGKGARKVSTAESLQAAKIAVFKEILEKLASSGLSFGQLMLYVFDPIYKKGVQRGTATEILNLWVSNKNGPTAREEVGTWAEDYVAGAMREEVQGITESKFLQTGSTAIDGDYVTSFSIMKMGTYLQGAARISMKMLTAFSTSSRNLRTLLKARVAKRLTIVTSTVLTLLGEFSHKNNFSHRILGLYLYATGAQRQTILVMSHLGISESYQSLTHKPHPELLSTKIKALERVIKPGTLQQLSQSMRSLARGVTSTGLFAAAYDNINLMFRVAEQVMGRTDLDAAFDVAPPLSITDILLTDPEMQLMNQCLRHCILHIIIEHGGDKFKRFCDDVEHSLPITADKIELHKTPLHPMPAWMIDESTIIGNAEVADALYTELEVKGLSHWSWIVKILCSDQLSIARLCSLLNIRAGHERGYSGFGWGVWIPGLFHGKTADMHGFFVIHWGVPHRRTRNPGSLSFHNTHLHCSPILLTSLPPFRVCRDLVFVSLYARVLHCLLLVSGKALLEECADSIHTFAELEAYAALIQSRFANAELVGTLRWQREMTKGTEGPTPSDEIFVNASLLLWDVLVSREFTDSIKAGDSGRIMLVLKLFALSFRGNRHSKYAYEMLHLIHNLTHVWNIVLNNWLVNPTGNPFSWVEVDLMQEHMNFWIKTVYKAHGSAASWEWLGMVAPCVTALRHLSMSIINILGSDQGTKHAPPDLSIDIKLLMDSLAKHDVYQVKGRVFAEGDGSPTLDVISVGIQQLTDSSSNLLNEYNEAFIKLQARRRLVPLISSWSESDIEMHAAVPNPPAPSDLPPPTTSAVTVITNYVNMQDAADGSGSEGDMDGRDNGFGLGDDHEIDMYAVELEASLEDAGFIVNDVDHV